MRIVRALVVLLLLGSICVGQTPTPTSRAWTAMVSIRGTGENGNPVSGSGFVVAPNGIIVTNLHLVKGLSSAKIELANGDIFDAFTMVSSDARRDLAILRIAGFDLRYVELGNSNQVQTGDAVLLVASAKEPIATGSVRGMLSADGFRLIQTSAVPEASAAGGLLLSANGEAIGVLGYRSSSPNAVAVPINFARGLLENAGITVASAKPPAAPVAAAAPKPVPYAPPAAQPARHAEETKAAPAAAVPTARETAPTFPEPLPPRQAPPMQMAEATPAAIASKPKSEFARPAPVRRIYIEPLGKGEGPQMLREKIARNLADNHFIIVNSAAEADAILSGSGKWANVRVEKFHARLVAADERELWSGDVSSGGWIRSASSSVADKLVQNLVHALAHPGE
ncbi:MAG: S1C family serine protease [Terriglobales bacterium]